MIDTPFDRRDVLAMGGLALGTAATAGYCAEPVRAAIADAPIAASLRALADRKHLLIGAAVLGRDLVRDPRLAAALRANANMLVPEVELKWQPLQPNDGASFDFAPAERVYDFCRANGMAMRGHTLTWYRDEPDWAKAAVAAMTPGQAGDFLERHVDAIVGHWRGRIAQWDVANEAIDGAQKLTEPLFAPKLGERYLDIAYHAARRADPSAMLVFNTDLIEMDDPYQERHRNATLGLLERLLKRGVPVHALGIEGHLRTSMRFSETVFRRFLDQVVGMGLRIMVTEFDINDRGTLGDMGTRDAAVASLGQAFLDVAFSYRQCGGMLTWALSDRYSWLRTEANERRADGAALRPSPLDDEFRPKPLWRAIAASVQGAPMRPRIGRSPPRRGRQAAPSPMR